MKPLTRIASILIVTLSLSLLVPVAHADQGSWHAHDHAQTAPTEIVVPETRAELWEAVQTGHAALLEAVKAGDGAAAHETEEKLQALLKALPEKLTDLDEAARTRIEGQARNLARAYDAVHHAADSKNWEKALAELKKAEGGMRLLAALMR